jgi:ADP-ribose pyrophosphatase YjhB (NUDIX family)
MSNRGARPLIELADEIRALATTGLHYTEGVFDRERYEKLLRIAARVAAHGTVADADKLELVFRAADQGYVTPKLDVRLAVFRGDEILLVREQVDGRWAMPGGFVDIGDTPSEAALREAAEEAGVVARVERLAGVFDLRLQPDCPPHLFHIHKLVFTGQLVDPTAPPRAGSEATEAGFWPIAALPELSLGRTLPLHVREALRVARDPAALPYFD